MQLLEVLAAAGMTPPRRVVPEKWMRFPGCGKGKSNRSGWCRLITPTLAIYGDWSTGLSEVWCDATHRDDAESRRLLEEARRRDAQLREADMRRQNTVALQAAELVAKAKENTHPYLIAKGFPHTLGLVADDQLLVPVRAADDYSRIISVQKIAPDGTKRFLPGGRTKGGIHRLGAPRSRTALCEGLATGLSVQRALGLLPGSWSVVVCFSAGNLVGVAPRFPGAIVCADHDKSQTGEKAARETGLKWVMPPECGEDFNDLMLRKGILYVVEALRHAARG